MAGITRGGGFPRVPGIGAIQGQVSIAEKNCRNLRYVLYNLQVNDHARVWCENRNNKFVMVKYNKKVIVLPGRMMQVFFLLINIYFRAFSFF